MKDTLIQSLVAVLIKGARYLLVIHGGVEMASDSSTKLEGAATIALGVSWSFGEDIYKARQLAAAKAAPAEPPKPA